MQALISIIFFLVVAGLLWIFYKRLPSNNFKDNPNEHLNEQILGFHNLNSIKRQIKPPILGKTQLVLIQIIHLPILIILITFKGYQGVPPSGWFILILNYIIDDFWCRTLKPETKFRFAYILSLLKFTILSIFIL